MRRLGRSLFIWLLGILTTGCAAVLSTPVMFDCRQLGMTPVTDTAQRLEFPSPGFSVLPPQGEHWCIQQSQPSGIAFVKSPLFGKLLDRRPQETEVAHTFVAMAREVSVEEAAVESPADLQAFVERWLRGGAGVRLGGPTMVLDTTPLARFKLARSKVLLDNSLQASCVRWDAVIEERDNPMVSGSVLIQTTRNNFLCWHPHSRERVFILIGYSERHVQGEQAQPPLVEMLKREVEPFLQSLRFVPPR